MNKKNDPWHGGMSSLKDPVYDWIFEIPGAYIEPLKLTEARAQEHAKKMARIWPGHTIYVYKLHAKWIVDVEPRRTY